MCETVVYAVIPPDLLKRTDVTPAAKVLYATIDACEREGVRFTTKELGKMCGLGERTVYRRLRELSDKKLIKR